MQCPEHQALGMVPMTNRRENQDKCKAFTKVDLFVARSLKKLMEQPDLQLAARGSSCFWTYNFISPGQTSAEIDGGK